MKPLTEVLAWIAQSFLLPLALAVPTAALVYFVLRPRMVFGRRIRRLHRDWQQDPVYQVAYRNGGVLPAYDVHLEAWIRLPISEDPLVRRLVPVPVLQDGHSYLPRSKSWNRPQLLLDRVEWDLFLPSSERPNNPNDLDEILQRYDAELFLAIAATTGLGGVRQVRRRSYRNAIGEADDG